MNEELLKQIEEQLDKYKDDNEAYHGIFDDIVMNRLKQVDSGFHDKMLEIKHKHDVCFWYA